MIYSKKNVKRYSKLVATFNFVALDYPIEVRMGIFDTTKTKVLIEYYPNKVMDSLDIELRNSLEQAIFNNFGILIYNRHTPLISDSGVKCLHYSTECKLGDLFKQIINNLDDTTYGGGMSC